MKITATTPIKHGAKDGVVDVAEGESIDVDKKTGDALIAAGAATAGGSGKAGKTDAEKAEDKRLADEAEIAAANKRAADEADAARRAAGGNA